MADKYMKKRSTSLAIRKMKTTRYHFTHAKKAIIKKSDNIKCW